MTALAAGAIELEMDTAASGQAAELAQQLIASHERWIAVAAIGVKRVRRDVPDRGR
jgi:hypothetical protein